MFVVPTFCIAQSEKLTLDQCRAMALEHNKEISKAKVQEKQLEFDVKSYKSNFFPRINLTAGDLYSTLKGNFTIAGGHLPIYSYVESLNKYVPDVTVNADGSYTLNKYADFPDQTLKYKMENIIYGGITFTQPIYMGGKITSAYNMSLIGKDMAKLNISITEDDIIIKTDEAYVLAIKAKEMILVANKYKSLLEELMKNVESAFSHGLKTRNDVMKVQVKLNEADLNITKAENGYRLACMNLCHYIGKPITNSIDIDSDSFDADATSNIINKELNITNRTEYELLNKRVELANQQVNLTRSDYLPNVILMGGYSYANGAKFGDKKLLDGGTASVSVGINIPIFNFGEGTNKVRSAKAKQQIALLEQDNLNEEMILEQQQALNNVEEAIKEVELTKSAFTQAEENMRLSKQQYEVGYESLSDYLEAQAIWQNNYADKINALCQYNLSWFKYLKSRGELK